MRLALITNAPFDTVSGASFYHRCLLSAWTDLGGQTEVAALTGAAPPDLANRFDHATSIIIEASAFEFAEAAIPDLQARGAAALIHHPMSLEPGMPQSRRHHLKALETAVLPGFGRVIAASAPIAQRLSAEFGVISDHVRVLVPGTDQRPRRLIDPTVTEGGRCTILSLGSLIFRKGHDCLIKALATLTDLDWHLILAGESLDPGYADDLDVLVSRLGLEGRVERHGALEGAQLDAIWARADLFALATRFEGFGMAIAEAMSRGLPVAITDGGAAGSLVTNGAGVVAPVDDVPQLAKAMRRLIFSPGLRAEMGGLAWAQARKLPTWPDQAAALRSIMRIPGGGDQ